MAGLFGRIFGGAPAESAGQGAIDEFESQLGPVRFRPRLITDLIHDHEDVRAALRAVLDACRGHDEDARIVRMQRFAKVFRRVCLAKSVHFYPYLRWALENDRMATIQFKTVHAELEQAIRSIDALLGEYLDSPWLNERRQRLTADIARVAHLLGPALRREESSLFPLYLPPGQYRYVRGARLV